MLSTPEKPRPHHQTLAPQLTTHSPISSPQLHVDFMKVRVHTAKCDSCEKHNKQTLYRCMECGHHVCAVCWDKSEDRTHAVGGGSRDVPGVNTGDVNGNNIEGRDKGLNGARTTRIRRRVQVISDDEDENLPVLTSAFTAGNAEAADTGERHQKGTKVMNHDHQRDHEDEQPSLWPISPSGGLQALRRTVPTVDNVDNPRAAEKANRIIQRNSHIHGDGNSSERRRIGHIYDDLGKQTVTSAYAFVDDQETSSQARRPPKSSVSNQQPIRSLPRLQPALNRQRPGVDVNQLAADNHRAFASNQRPIRQTLHHAQPPIAHHQQAPRRIPPPIHGPRPGVNLDQHAAFNQRAFAPGPHAYHQAPRPGQVCVPHQRALRPAPRPAQTSFSISEQHAQAAANADQARLRNQTALYVQRAQAYVDARQTEARGQQAMSSHRNVRPAADWDEVAARNQGAFSSNPLPPPATGHEQILGGHDRQHAYLAHQQAYFPRPGSAHSSVSYQRDTNLSPLPSSGPARNSILHQRATNLSPLPSPGSAQNSVSYQRAANSPLLPPQAFFPRHEHVAMQFPEVG